MTRGRGDVPVQPAPCPHGGRPRARVDGAWWHLDGTRCGGSGYVVINGVVHDAALLEQLIVMTRESDT